MNAETSRTSEEDNELALCIVVGGGRQAKSRLSQPFLYTFPSYVQSTDGIDGIFGVLDLNTLNESAGEGRRMRNAECGCGLLEVQRSRKMHRNPGP
jgi:hypothetical protein